MRGYLESDFGVVSGFSEGFLELHERCTSGATVQALTITNQHKTVAFSHSNPYNIAHSGWLLSGDVEAPRPHNPLVAGSNPACPILSQKPGREVACMFQTCKPTSFPTMIEARQMIGNLEN